MRCNVAPSPETEARKLLPLARQLGVEQVRRIITVSDEERAQITAWAQNAQPWTRNHFEKILRFREATLVYFDKLIKDEARKVV